MIYSIAILVLFLGAAVYIGIFQRSKTLGFWLILFSLFIRLVKFMLFHFVLVNQITNESVISLVNILKWMDWAFYALLIVLMIWFIFRATPHRSQTS